MATVKTPFTTTMTSHGLLIRSASGEAVGAITSWSPRQSRVITPVFEFGGQTTGGGADIRGNPGEPYEIVPGNIQGTTIDIRRYDIYSKRFEQAFKTNNLEMLTNQDKSISLIEFWATPEGALDFTYIYYGCWFNSIGREHSADGNRVVMANAQVTFTRRREFAGTA